jgi:NAD(P)-dependent dehydrogenase (short-subunit alcohol dehydrogenase family)
LPNTSNAARAACTTPEGSATDDISLHTWRWVIDVNLMGVLHGIHAFLPHIRDHGEGGHIVNTASMAGMNSGLGFSAYSASKFAVVNMSEGLAKQVAPLGIGVTVVCPGFVRTHIWTSGRNRPARYGPAVTPNPASPAGEFLARLVELGQSGLDPADVAAQVLTAIRDNELYVFTHAGPTWRAELGIDLTPSSQRWIRRRYDRWDAWNRCSLGLIDGAFVMPVVGL